jgi:hypothetical protein
MSESQREEQFQLVFYSVSLLHFYGSPLRSALAALFRFLLCVLFIAAGYFLFFSPFLILRHPSIHTHQIHSLSSAFDAVAAAAAAAFLIYARFPSRRRCRRRCGFVQAMFLFILFELFMKTQSTVAGCLPHWLMI